ncbi:MAG TPA: ABC transporter permease [Streptosporangiaceae bacterium]|jgi:ABC-2 type transport system permease protein|nr:ABC transporter permease [Streptosporangiaceae bacterium]
MTGFGKLAFVETKLFLRERAAVAALLGLPVALVAGFGLIPGFAKPDKSLSGQIGTEYIASLGVAIVIALLALNGIPMVLGTYREKGILRRLSATPVRPATLLTAKLAVWLATVVVSIGLMIGAGRLAFGVPLPSRPGWFVLSVALGVAALFALGLFVAAVAPTGRAAAGIGMLVFFPNMFLGGVWFPTEQMSHPLQVIGDCVPLGAALHAVRQSWMGQPPHPLYLGIMAAWAAAAGLAAARFFRWE